jgi:hypothetical protein
MIEVLDEPIAGLGPVRQCFQQLVPGLHFELLLPRLDEQGDELGVRA